jgi:DNA topoisomerase VI subunit B
MDRRRQEAEAAERRERERLAEIEPQRVERLLGEAKALRKAQAIRAYVKEVRAASPAAMPVELENWATWAREQANKIDPVAGGFLNRPSER